MSIKVLLSGVLLNPWTITIIEMKVYRVSYETTKPTNESDKILLEALRYLRVGNEEEPTIITDVFVLHDFVSSFSNATGGDPIAALQGMVKLFDGFVRWSGYDLFEWDESDPKLDKSKIIGYSYHD